MSINNDLNIYPTQSDASHWSSTCYADLQTFDISGVVSGFVHLAVALGREAAFRPTPS